MLLALPLLLSAALVAPSGFYEARVLEPAASFVAGKPAHVYCGVSDSAWVDYLGGNFAGANVNGLTVPGSSETRLNPAVCRWLRARLNNLAGPTERSVAGAALTLVHESIHERGSVDEGATECQAMHELPRVAVRFFRVKPGRELRAFMAGAWYFHRTKPAAFQSVC